MHRPVQRCFRFVGLPVVLLLTTPILGAAQLIYTNGVPDNENGWPVIEGWRVANDFPLLSTTQLGSFEWYLIRDLGGGTTISSDFNWAIHADDAGGAPGTVLGSGTVTNATGTKTAFFCCGAYPYYDTYIFSNVSFGGLTLGAGQYWLAIGGYVDPIEPSNGWWATSSAFAGNQWQLNPDEGLAWVYTNAEGAFSIYGTESTDTVPEPASMALLGTGLVGVFGAVRRRRRDEST